MTAAIPIDTNEYRVLLVAPESRGLYALEREGEYRLIRVIVAQRARLARELQKTLRNAWGLAVLILDILTTEDSMLPCAVAEILHGELPAEFRRIQPEQLQSDELSEQERVSLHAVLDGAVKSPLAGIGWIDEAIAWLETSAGRRVLSKSDVEQYNAGGGFTVSDGTRMRLLAQSNRSAEHA